MPRKRQEIIQLIRQATALQTPVLDLSKCNLGELLEDVLKMHWLTELNLAHCHISVLPDEIGNLNNLTRLDLSENQLAALPESVLRLTVIQSLNLTRAGYNFKLSAPLEKWVEAIPEVIWENTPPPAVETAPAAFLSPDHPNFWLARIKDALKLYSDAFNMEERGIDGTGTRTRADQEIERIFTQIYELKELFPEFYNDFKEHRFYWSSPESEKTIDGNPFRLPTSEDDRARARFSAMSDDLPPLSLLDEKSHAGRKIFAINTGTCQKSEVFVSEDGWITISNQPSARDERYFADSEAQLFQAGAARFYVRAEIYGRGGGNTHWYGSDDGGLTWQKQAVLTDEWLADNCRSWRKLNYLCRREAK